ncbi:MAG: protease modulator HflK [Verrucomicrobiota bacterium]
MNDHSHDQPKPAPAPVTPDDAGSQALAEALRSSFAIVKFVMVALVIVFLASGFFQVGPQEQAVILRFGRPVGTGQKALLGPGLHWSFPYPIDEVVRIPIKEVQNVTSTVGWYYMTPEEVLAYKATGAVPPAGGTLNPAVDGYVITADRNIIHVSATLYYQVDEPIRYVFGFVSASNLVQNALNNALLYTAAHFGVDDMLYSDVAGFQDAVEQRAAQLADRERLGITIKQCTVERAPPRQLKDIFDQVTEARENRNKILDDAHTYENQVTNSADARASAIINEARSARARYVQSVQADAKAFSALLPNYQINPGLFEQQELVQVMGQALTNVQFKSYLPTTADGKPIELRLMLNREPPGARTANP